MVTIETYHSIYTALRHVMDTNKVNIHHASIGGDHARGLANENSVCVVNFVYSRPLENYLAIVPKSNYIEYKVGDSIKLVGTDIRKTMHLLSRSDHQVIEMFRSEAVLMIGDSLCPFRSVALTYLNLNTLACEYFCLASGETLRLGLKATIKDMAAAAWAILMYLYITRHKDYPVYSISTQDLLLRLRDVLPGHLIQMYESIFTIYQAELLCQESELRRQFLQYIRDFQSEQPRQRNMKTIDRTPLDAIIYDAVTDTTDQSRMFLESAVAQLPDPK